MASLPKAHFMIALLILAVGLTGCALPRNSNENADLQPVEALPPTLAPLGAESSELPAAEATAIPTVINVQPTATTSPLGAGEAAPSPNETVAPTAQPPSVPVTPVANNSQAEQVVVEPETFVAPTEAAPADEPVVVDATSAEQPAAGPVAANPPAGGSSEPAAYGDGNYTVQPGDTLFSIGMRYGTTAEAIMAANGLTSDMVYAGQTLTIPTDDAAAYPMPPEAGSAPMANPGLHIVAAGETLFSIARRYGTTVEAIAGANGIPYPFVIYEGQNLAIPGEGEVYPAPPPPGAGYYPPQYPQGPMPENGYYPPQYPQGPTPENGYYPPQYPPQGPGPDSGYYPPPYPPQAPEGYNPVPGNNPMPGASGTHTVAPGETLYSIARYYGTTAEAIAGANGLMNPNQIYVGQVLYLP